MGKVRGFRKGWLQDSECYYKGFVSISHPWYLNVVPSAQQAWWKDTLLCESLRNTPDWLTWRTWEPLILAKDWLLCLAWLGHMLTLEKGVGVIPHSNHVDQVCFLSTRFPATETASGQLRQNGNFLQAERMVKDQRRLRNRLRIGGN